jgi:cobalt/nickel transport system permease protein
MMSRIDPRVLVLCTVACVAAVSLTPPGRWGRLGAEAAIVMTGMAAAQVSWRRLAARLALLAPFVLMAAVSFALTHLHAGSTAGGTQAPAASLAAGLAHGAGPGVLAATAVAKALISVGAMTALTSVLTVQGLIQALQALGLPGILVTLMAFLLRYLGVLEEEAARMIRARDARGTPAGLPLAARAAVAGHLVGCLFVRSYARAGRISRAMQARGFDGTLLRGEPRPVPRSSWYAGVLFLLALIGVCFA